MNESRHDRKGSSSNLSRQWRRWLLGLSFAVICLALLLIGILSWGFLVAGPVDVRLLEDHQHPLYRRQRTAAGDVEDYLQAAERLHFEGVTPENNLALVFLEVSPSDLIYESADVLLAFRQKMHFRELAADRLVAPVAYGDNRQSRRFFSFARDYKDYMRSQLEQQSTVLDRIVMETVARNRFACPECLTENGEAPYGCWSIIRDSYETAAFWLEWRVSIAFQEQRLADAWSDLAAILRIAQAVSQHTDKYSLSDAQSLQTDILKFVKRILESPDLDIALAQKIHRELFGLLELQDDRYKTDYGLRASAITTMDQRIQGKELTILNPISEQSMRLPQGFINRTEAMNLINEVINRKVDLCRSDLSETRKEKLWDEFVMDWKLRVDYRNLILTPRRTATCVAVRRVAEAVDLLEFRQTKPPALFHLQLLCLLMARVRVEVGETGELPKFRQISFDERILPVEMWKTERGIGLSLETTDRDRSVVWLEGDYWD